VPAARQPALFDLLADASRPGREAGPGYCAKAAWHGTLRATLRRLVGPHADGEPDPLLRTAEALDVAACRLEAVLGPCRHRGR
jgi:hypothetical protein